MLGSVFAFLQWHIFCFYLLLCPQHLEPGVETILYTAIVDCFDIIVNGEVENRVRSQFCTVP